MFENTNNLTKQEQWELNKKGKTQDLNDLELAEVIKHIIQMEM